MLIVGNGRLIRARDGQPIGRGLAPANVSAIVDQEHIYFIQDPAQALRIPKQLTADWEPEIAWETSLKGGNTYASPVLDQGKIFTVSAKGILTVLDTNGQTLLTRRLDFGNGTVYPSLTAAHGTIYISHDSGTTIVLKNEEGFPEVARNQLDPFMSSPVFAGNNLLIRTRKGLYCIAPGK